ncbi:antirestriction protein ArdR [Shewanella algae]|uniref:antirestriction protein ArdR n=1 Tax=Shewanella TaxID=22 RepID=UPI0031F52FCA
MTPNSKARALAKKWRSENPERVGGVVLVWEEKVYGWKNKLRDPSSERPGVIAVDDEGHLFLAEGGNDDNGASVWTVITQSS